MIAITRTASIAPGKAAFAMRFAHAVAKFVKDKHGTNIDVLLPVGGNPNRIAWYWRLEGLEQWEALTGKLMTDKKYMDLVAKNSDAFLAGSIHDEIWRSI
jgi:hypothetical protein